MHGSILYNGGKGDIILKTSEPKEKNRKKFRKSISYINAQRIQVCANKLF